MGLASLWKGCVNLLFTVGQGRIISLSAEQRHFSLTVRQRGRVHWGRPLCMIIITTAMKSKSKNQFQHGVRTDSSLKHSEWLSKVIATGKILWWIYLISHRKPNPYYYMWNLKKKKVQMNLSTKQKQSYWCRKQTYSYQGIKRGGINWRIGIDIYTLLYITSGQFSSVTQSCQTLCDPVNRSTPGLPVHHQPPEFTQTHVHRVGDAIQPSHPLLSPSPPAPNPSQHQGLFKWVSSSH